MSDFIVHCEDDTVPAKDCLKLMEHCRGYVIDEQLFSVSSYSRKFGPPFKLCRRNAYTCWLPGIWKSRWEWIKSRWSPDPNLYASHTTALLKKHRVKEIAPVLSRCQNIGREGGFNVTPEQHDVEHHTNYWAGDYDLLEGEFYETVYQMRGEV